METGSWDLPDVVKRKLIELQVLATKRKFESTQIDPKQRKTKEKQYIDNVLEGNINNHFLSLDNLFASRKPYISGLKDDKDLKHVIMEKNLLNLDGNSIKNLKIQEHRKFFNSKTYEGILSSVRLELLSGEITVDNLTKRGDIKFRKQNYQGALRYYNLAIDHLQIVNTHIYEKTKVTQLKLAELLSSRAKCNLKLRNFYDTEYDTRFILYDNVFNESFINSNQELYDALKRMNSEAKNQISMQKIASNELAQNRSEEQVSTRATKKKFTVSKTIDLNNLNVMLSSEITKENHQNINEICPICSDEWSEMIHTSIIARLPCEHACCAKCLQMMHKIGCDKGQEEEGLPNFSCPLCRSELKAVILKEIARRVVKNGLVESFDDLGKMLQVNKDKRERLIISLLVNN